MDKIEWSLEVMSTECLVIPQERSLILEGDVMEDISGENEKLEHGELELKK